MASIKKLLESKEKIVVTAALPYANGEMHVGHVLEHIQVDIYTRFLRLIGKDAILICASDMHGTPIEVNAKKVGKQPEEYALPFCKKHQKDFAKYLVKYDNYYKTHSPENKEMAYYFYKILKDKGYIYIKEIPTVFCSSCNRHLPDRFVKGICPHCNEEDQYGDICEKCSTALKGIDLVNPKCTLCGNEPEHKNSSHYFFKLKDFSLELQAWFNDDNSLIQKEIKNWITNWIKGGLDDWCISRDEPYFGFEVPDCLDEIGEKKYLYVWLDAPIGYISSTVNYCDKMSSENKDLNWEDYWKSDKGQVLHFIGKDIAYFHYLFWPAVLKGAGFPLPVLTTHGFVNLNSSKMSKSRGNYFSAAEFFELFGAEGLRFYYANRLDRSIVDLDLSLDDFEAVNNKVLIANLGNFCYRSLSFAAKNYSQGFDKVANGDDEQKLVEEFNKLVHSPNGVKDCYYGQNFKGAVKLILQISDLGNVYFQKLEPWKKRESEEGEKLVCEKIAFILNLARNLSILIKPILPEFSAKIEKSFGVESVVGKGCDGLQWEDINFDWTGHIEMVDKLVDRIDAKIAKERLNVVTGGDVKSDSKKENCLPLSLRVGQVVEIKNHSNAEKLYVLQVDFGGEIGKKQIVSGLRGHFEPNDLLFHKFLFCINLQPVKLRGEMSEGMILVAEEKDEGGEKLTLLELKPSQFENVELGEFATFGDLIVCEDEIDYKQFLKVKMKILGCKVVWKEKSLNVAGKELGLPDVSDGAKIS